MLQKQAIDISFAKGLDTKTDPKRVSMGNFIALRNSVFTKSGQLTKRNGYQKLASLPDNSSTYLNTFNGNLTAVGTSIAAYNASNASWVSKGSIQPLSVDVLPLLRNNLNQTAADSAIAPNGLICTAYLEQNAGSTTNKYVIADSVTGQNITAPAVIPVASGTVSGGMRVFVLGNNFIIVFTNTITATAHLQYITISLSNPSTVGANTDIASAYIAATTLSWDAWVSSNKLFIAYNTTTGGQSVKVTSLTSTLALNSALTLSGYKATMMSVTSDETNASNPVIYVSFYRLDTTVGYTLAIDQNLNLLMNPVLSIASGTILNLTSVAQNGSCKIFYEVSNAYSFAAGIPTNFINSRSITPLLTTFRSIFSIAAGAITASSATGLVNGMYLIDNTTPSNIAAGTTFTVSGTTLTLSINTAGNSAASPGDLMTTATLSAVTTIIRSVGLASKAFLIDGVVYFLSAYSSPYQPTYFLINGSASLSSSPVIAAKLAYSNGGGYLTTGLPNVTIMDNIAHMAYRFKDLITAVNKGTAVEAGTQTNGIYSQTGINLATFTFGTDGLDTAEIGKDLHLTGGFLWMYDGYLPVEHNFFLWPDTDQTTPTNTATWSAIGGSMVAKPDGSTNTNAYYYQFTYEWTDNNGNAFRSAPSIPIAVTTTGALSTGSVTLNIATLRLTYKTANPVKVVIYRWSVAQQVYYQTTSITSPLLNDTTVDQVQFVDTNSDATILGNNILYTTGGVVEDVNAPASDLLTLFDTRLFLVDAEDRNLLWYSKQVIENTPVEMSDLFTIYVAPTTAAQGSTGPMTAISVMDDKLAIFKRNAIYYINGVGPDNTGSNNQYSQPVFITSTIGCTNQKSIVFMPRGLMFQSDKGIWLLGRDLQTSYIGAPVEAYNTSIVVSAQNIPQTNQVRFILDSGVTLMYDYYYDQWGTFSGVPAISSTIFDELDTFINSYGDVYQESPGSYLDGSQPVLMSFTTGPLRLGELQNYQRAYFFYILGTYRTPHKLRVSMAYDYSASPSQSVILTPNNFAPTYAQAGYGPYGQNNPYAGPATLEQFRLFLERQRCQAFSITLEEIYDGTYGVPAGAGLTISGLNVVCGFKQKFVPISSAQSFGQGNVVSLYAEYIKERTNDKILELDVGFATYRYLNQSQVYIVDIYVKEEHRKVGFAASIADRIAKEAKQNGCTEMIGTVVPSTKNATASISILIAYGMSLISSSNDLIVLKKDL